MKFIKRYGFTFIIAAALYSSIVLGADITADYVMPRNSEQKVTQSLIPPESTKLEAIPAMEVADGTQHCCCGDGVKEPKICANGPSGCSCYCKGTPRTPVFECK